MSRRIPGPTNTATVRIVHHGETPVSVGEPVGNNRAFAARLTNTEPGRVWELVLRSTQPLPNANHYARFTLPTSCPEVPRLEVTAFVPALSAIVTTPRQIQLPPTPLAEARTVTVWVRGTTDHALKLGEITPPTPEVGLAVEEREPGRLYRVQLTFPKAFASARDRKAE